MEGLESSGHFAKHFPDISFLISITFQYLHLTDKETKFHGYKSLPQEAEIINHRTKVLEREYKALRKQILEAANLGSYSGLI